jgi:hypothetical protein
MIFIAHRGLIDGPNSNKENKLSTIDIAIKKGFDVEIDIWAFENKIFLGHDEKKLLEIDFKYLEEYKKVFWIHTKNFGALKFFSEIEKKEEFNYFWHQEDSYTLTSQNIPWIYPGCKPISSGILVMPENVMDINNFKTINVNGVCSDYIQLIKENIYFAK